MNCGVRISRHTRTETCYHHAQKFPVYRWCPSLHGGEVPGRKHATIYAKKNRYTHTSSARFGVSVTEVFFVLEPPREVWAFTFYRRCPLPQRLMVRVKQREIGGGASSRSVVNQVDDLLLFATIFIRIVTPNQWNQGHVETQSLH